MVTFDSFGLASRCVALLFALGACRSHPASPPEKSSDTDTVRSAESATPLEAGVDAAVVQVLGRGVRVIVVDGGRVVTRRPGDQTSSLALVRAPRDEATELSVEMAPFFGHAELLDVTVVESTEHGWHHAHRETHYLVDTSGASDVLACVFAGDTSSAGEYASSSTTIAIKQTAPKPLAFDVARTTSSRASQPRGRDASSGPAMSVDHFEIGASSCASAPPP